MREESERERDTEMLLPLLLLLLMMMMMMMVKMMDVIVVKQGGRAASNILRKPASFGANKSRGSVYLLV